MSDPGKSQDSPAFQFVDRSPVAFRAPERPDRPVTKRGHRPTWIKAVDPPEALQKTVRRLVRFQDQGLSPRQPSSRLAKDAAGEKAGRIQNPLVQADQITVPVQAAMLESVVQQQNVGMKALGFPCARQAVG